MDSFSTSDKHQRLFIAIEIRNVPGLSEFISKIKSLFPNSRISWVSPQNLHVTLFFLGNTPEYFIQAIIKAIGVALVNFFSFKLQLKGLETFNKQGVVPRVVFVDIVNPECLLGIYNLLQFPLRELGVIDKETQKFRPHLTLGRLKNFADKSGLLKAQELGRNSPCFVCNINSVILFRSELSQQEPKYTKVFEQELIDFRVG